MNTRNTGARSTNVEVEKVIFYSDTYNLTHIANQSVKIQFTRNGYGI